MLYTVTYIVHSLIIEMSYPFLRIVFIYTEKFTLTLRKHILLNFDNSYVIFKCLRKLV